MNNCFNSVKARPASGIHWKGMVVEVSLVRRGDTVVVDDPFEEISKAQEALNLFWG